MTTETAKPTSHQTGTTPDPIASNAQDFSGSDDEVLDNFAEVPSDQVPMGLGGEAGKQSEPASSTLEADIVNGTTKQSGEKLPSDYPAGGPEPVQEPAGDEGTETTPEPISEEPKTPEFPPALLQMAGYADAAAAQNAGFNNPDALLAAVQWRSQLLTPGTQVVQPAPLSEQGLYRRPAQPSTPSVSPAPEPVAKPEDTADFKAFQLPTDKRDMLDDDLVDVLDQMNEHYQHEHEHHQQELKSLRSSVSQREADITRQQAQEESARFDKVVNALGDEWKDVFGEGSGTDLARMGQDDPAAMTNFNHRVRLFETVEAVREVNAKQQYKPMTVEQEVQWALLQRYPDKFQHMISGNSDSSQSKGVTASRPTQRKTPPKNQNQKVLADVDAMLQKRHGHSLDMGQEDEFDGREI